MEGLTFAGTPLWQGAIKVARQSCARRRARERAPNCFFFLEFSQSFDDTSSWVRHQRALSLCPQIYTCVLRIMEGEGVQGRVNGEFDRRGGGKNARVTVDRFNPVVSGAKLSISSILCVFWAPFCEKVPVS